MKKASNFIYVTFLIAFIINNSQLEASFECSNNHSTECNYKNGTKTCCPIKDAVCCSDSNFCCPKGFECDSNNNRCTQNELFIPFHLRQQVLDPKESIGKEILCPDNQTYCKETQTCCLFGENDYGCCPIAKAICCEDKVHCCPAKYKCNPSQGKCDRVTSNDLEIFSINWYKKQPGKKLEQKVNVECPDKKSQCPSGSTCCQLSSGEYGCCPLPEAVCCEDHLHCCPKSYVCDVKDGRCNKQGEESILFLRKTPSILIEKKSIEESPLNQVCPGGSSECPDGTTCCQLSSGDWGCCPIPNAVCCSDHLHCCPSGYVCDIKEGRCNKQGEASIPLFKKFISKLIKNNLESTLELENENKISFDIPEKKFEYKANSVVCPDGCSFCPNGYTCCKMSDGSYACCPLPNAVCCEDHLHCCPFGTRCNLQKQSCDTSNGLVGMSWSEKIPSKLLYNKNEKKVANDPIVCDDKVTTCDPLKTCCKMSDGTYGCCQYSDGVCCSDLSFCCPGDSVCGKNIGECIPKNTMQKLEMKTNRIPEKIDNQKVADDCEGPVCKAQDGSSLCCPYKNGSCCGSHGYCCPNKYTCNPTQESCQYNDDEIEPVKVFINTYKNLSKRLVKEFDETEFNNVECEDSIHFCPDSSTCCKTKDSYGCCAIPNAVCCEDGINCCPTGYVCSTNSTATCIKKNIFKISLN